MRIPLFLFILFLFIACAGNNAADNSGPEISPREDGIYGKVGGLPGRKVLLFGLHGDQVSLIDSAFAGQDGSFEFYFPSQRERGLYRIAMGRSTDPGQYDQHRQQFDIIWDGSPVMFKTNYESPVDSMEIDLSEENNLYYRYLKQMQEFDRKMGVLNNALINYPRGDSFYRRLERQHRRVQNRRSNFVDNLVKKNGGSITASIAKFMKIPGTGNPNEPDGLEKVKKEFFSEGQFDDPVLLRTDLIHRKVIRYLSLYTGNNLDEEEQQDEMISAVDVIMQHAMANEEIFYFLVEYLINGFNSMGMDLVSEHLTGRYLLGNVCFETGRLLDQESPSPVSEMNEGDPIPGFSFEALDGRMVDLDNIQAEYTLLLFWGSWCHFCEGVMGDIYEIYSDYRTSHEGYFEVVAIGIEDDREMWLEVIEKGGYDWINYTSLMRWDCPIASGFDLIGTPTMILIDRDKRFVNELSSVRVLRRELRRQL